MKGFPVVGFIVYKISELFTLFENNLQNAYVYIGFQQSVTDN